MLAHHRFLQGRGGPDLGAVSAIAATHQTSRLTALSESPPETNHPHKAEGHDSADSALSLSRYPHTATVRESID